MRVSKANAARIAPTREGYVNAIQVWPSPMARSIRSMPGRVTVVSLQPGEELVTVAAGDTVRWIVGDVQRQRRRAARERAGQAHPLGPQNELGHHHQPPHHLLELTSTQKAWMASVSWDYPKDRMLACGARRRRPAAGRYRPVAGEDPLPLRSVRQPAVEAAAPSMTRVYPVPGGHRSGELPPLFVIGAQGGGQLVNYRFRSPYYIVDRLFGAAELRLGGDGGDVVRIERTDGVARRN